MGITTAISMVTAMVMNLAGIDASVLQRLCDTDPEVMAIVRALDHPIHTWTPRPAKPELYDEQESFVLSLIHI